MPYEDWSKLLPLCRTKGRPLNLDVRQFMNEMQLQDPNSDISTKWRNLKNSNLTAYSEYYTLKEIEDMRSKINFGDKSLKDSVL